MIKIEVIVRNGETNINITGHAEYAPNGQDIVCAAISAISHTTILGLNAIAESYPENVQIEIYQGLSGMGENPMPVFIPKNNG